VLAVIFLMVISNWQYAHEVEQVERRLHDTAVVLRSHLEGRWGQAPPSEFQQLVQHLSKQTATRLTIMAADGVVLADSDEDPSRMENHRLRPELQQAAGDAKIGIVKRRSPTLGIAMLYLALPVQRDGNTVGFVRVAMDIESIDRHVAATERFIWMLAMAVGLLAVGLTYAVASRIVRPLADLTQRARAIAAGDYQQSIKVNRRDELGTLGAAFNHMQQQLARRMSELQENSARLGTVLGSMDEGVIAVDRDERILLANEASRVLLECTRRDVVARPLLEVTRSRPIHEAVATALRTEQPLQGEFETSAATRRTLAMQVTCLPGQPCPGVVIVLHDVSELRRLENLRREFVANVSHELKTPLASIKAYAETLRLGAIHDDEHNVVFVARIEEQADRLYQLILDLLQIARLESGQELFEITNVPLADVVEACTKRYADAATAKRISLEVTLPPEPLKVRADEEGLNTILDNLLDNAIKYTPEDGQVTIRWSAENSHVWLEVTDTGIGIAPQDQPRVFERFFRVHKARSRELGGTGLGLSIVKHLAQSFGGTVGIESRVGKGSTFRVKLPRA
jgi:two-component system phosphate regulon sensor histidine kinase PhoR